MLSGIFFMLRYILSFIFSVLLYNAMAQNTRATVVDAHTLQLLPFAAVQVNNSEQGTVADIKGQFNIHQNKAVKKIKVSYTGYTTQNITAPFPDTIFLSPVQNTIDEIVVRPPYEKIRRIINTAINNKKNNNPELYDRYQCNVYYKLKFDYLIPDSLFIKDSSYRELKEVSEKSHVLLTETFSKWQHTYTSWLLGTGCACSQANHHPTVHIQLHRNRNHQSL